jgi:hypothetical protein
MLPLEVVGPGGSLSTATIAAPYKQDASRESWQAATATEGGGAWHGGDGGEENSRNRTVATGRMRRSSIGWGTAGGGSGGADRLRWRRTLNLCHDYLSFNSARFI